MWLQRSNTTRYDHDLRPLEVVEDYPVSPCLSFKDVQSLFPEENNIPKSQNRNVFHCVRRVKSLFSAISNSKQIELPGTETRVVIFFTSLGVVRSTFDDCNYVKSILRSFRMAIEERDVSMDWRFMEELKRIMDKDEKTDLTLPQVFIGGRYIGGAEEIRQLWKTGELKKYLHGLAPAPQGTCKVCGGHEFLLCLKCNGSHKFYLDKRTFNTCTVCNENGLIKCPFCPLIL